jgi:hypothetical protein
MKCKHCLAVMHAKCSKRTDEPCVGVKKRGKTEFGGSIKFGCSYRDGLIDAVKNGHMGLAGQLCHSDEDRVYFSDPEPPFKTALEIVVERPDCEDIAVHLVGLGADLTRTRFHDGCSVHTEDCVSGETGTENVKLASALETAARKGLIKVLNAFLDLCERSPLAKDAHSSRKLTRGTRDASVAQRAQSHSESMKNGSQFLVLGTSRRRPRANFEFADGSQLVHVIFTHGVLMLCPLFLLLLCV